ncbi:MAG TPA: lasso peptide biosynthesis protein [Anaerolineae bacterium]|nr:lasso peptide biosynthesis protein [Anaerolineae bacterium]
MVSKSFESKYAPQMMWKRAARIIREPADILLSLQLGYFIWRVPAWLDRMPLPQLLQALQSAPPPPSSSFDASLERIQRLIRPWFKLPMFRNRNTCYLRSLLFYRFLDPHDKSKRIHFVVEPSRAPGARLHGHAWVTIGDQLIEPPLPDILARTQSIYTYPPHAT